MRMGSQKTIAKTQRGLQELSVSCQGTGSFWNSRKLLLVVTTASVREKAIH